MLMTVPTSLTLRTSPSSIVMYLLVSTSQMVGQAMNRRLETEGRTLICGMLVSATLSTVLHRPASATVLDQENPAFSTSNAFLSTHARAQTFTVGLSGQLAAVEAYLGNPFERFESDLILSVRPTDSEGVPLVADDFDLATSTLSVAVVPRGKQFIRFEFAEPLPEVQVGDVLAIIIWATGPVGNVGWGGSINDPYPQGTGYSLRQPPEGEPWSPSSIDLSFRTYVLPVPEPSAFTIAVLGIGLVAAHGLGRRR